MTYCSVWMIQMGTLFFLYLRGGRDRRLLFYLQNPYDTGSLRSDANELCSSLWFVQSNPRSYLNVELYLAKVRMAFQANVSPVFASWRIPVFPRSNLSYENGNIT